MTKPINFTHNDYEIIEREVLYQGVFRLVRYHIRQRLFNGDWSEVYQRELLERRQAACVLPYDPYLDRVILIEQFRPGALAEPVSPWLIEIPAGVLADNETSEELAKREAKEETGCILYGELELICEYFASPGGTNEYLHVYCGKTDASKVGGIHGLLHEQEDIRVMNISAEEAFVKLRTGHIKTPPAIVSLMWLQLHRARLRATWL